MKLNIYQVDAFAEELFKGNPAAVIPLRNWLPDNLLQAIAQENNLSETAFFVEGKSGYEIRWFTPGSEVDLCGHATLASAHVLFNHIGLGENVIHFNSKSGILKVEKHEKGMISMDFPSQKSEKTSESSFYKNIFGKEPLSVYLSTYPMVVFENEQIILDLKPDFNLIQSLATVGVIVTAQSIKYDFVSRFFAPGVGIDEDPVTGSAHTILIPYWSEVLGKTSMVAYQSSKRGGKLYCEYMGERVKIAGNALTYMVGEIEV